jgi:hypothetical protein
MAQDLEHEAAIRQITQLAHKYGVSLNELQHLSSASIPSSQPHKVDKIGTSLNKLLNYFGAALIFMGMGYLISMLWVDLSPPMRVAIWIIPAVLALYFAIKSLQNQECIALSTPLFLITYFLEAAGLTTFLIEYGEGNNVNLAVAIISGPLLLQALTLFKKYNRTNALFFTFVWASVFIGNLLNWVNFDNDLATIITAISILCIGYGYDFKNHQVVKKTIYLIAPFAIYITAYFLFKGVFLDASLITISGLMLYASVSLRSIQMLWAAILSTLGTIMYFTNEYFADFLSWPVALIISGLAMIAFSRWAFKLSRKIKEK